VVVEGAEADEFRETGKWDLRCRERGRHGVRRLRRVEAVGKVIRSEEGKREEGEAMRVFERVFPSFVSYLHRSICLERVQRGERRLGWTRRSAGGGKV
jgi:hypothetical protein